MNIRRRYSISVCFVYGLEEKDSKSEVIVCRLPSAVNVMLNLSIVRKESWIKTSVTVEYQELLFEDRS